MSHNPAAFPVNSANLGQGGAYAPEPGMSLRDWFAGQALAGVLANRALVASIREQAGVEGIEVDRAIALFCRQAADAMLAARQEGQK